MFKKLALGAIIAVVAGCSNAEPRGYVAIDYVKFRKLQDEARQSKDISELINLSWFEFEVYLHNAKWSREQGFDNTIELRNAGYAVMRRFLPDDDAVMLPDMYRRSFKGKGKRGYDFYLEDEIIAELAERFMNYSSKQEDPLFLDAVIHNAADMRTKRIQYTLDLAKEKNIHALTALLYLKTGQKENALKEYQEAMNDSGNHRKIKLHLAQRFYDILSAHETRDEKSK